MDQATRNESTRWRITRYVAALWLIGPTLLAAQTPPTDYPMQAEGRLILALGAGQVHILAHPSPVLSITGHENLTWPQPVGNEREWQLDLSEMAPGQRVTVRVPVAAGLEIDASGADIRIEGLSGARIRAFNTAGSIEVLDSRPNRLDLETIQGRLMIDAHGLESTRLKSISGAIRAHGLSGRVKLSSLTGPLSIRGSDIAELEADTVSGDIEAHLQPSRGAIMRVSSHEGAINITLPENTPLEARLQSHRGPLSSDFEPLDRSASTWRIRQATGEISLEARSFSSAIRLEAGPAFSVARVMALVYRVEEGRIEVAEFGHDREAVVRLRAGQYALIALPATSDLIYVRADRPGQRPEHGRWELGVERWGEGLNCFEILPHSREADMAWVTDAVGRALLVARHFTLEPGPCPTPEALQSMTQIDAGQD